MPGALRHLSYTIDGLAEQLLVIGDGSPRVLFVPPLFDEMNRMRRTLVLAMHALAQRDIASALMDLPGCNESLAQLDTQSLTRWRDAVVAAAAVTEPDCLASLRGGCLIDDGADPAHRWRLSPAKGASLLKTLLRTRIAGEREDGRTVTAAQLIEQSRLAPIELAGNWLGPQMVAELHDALPAALPAREVKPGTGPSTITGSALWLRAEPGEDAAMAHAIVSDIAQLMA
ncbi:hypothetical protein [Novosphingopyxis baekryungensis]|uniref:hypothetical protein n=1 Tax=Novosphingopyxis baekryungensis TaxID=279369 RepID=UPI0003B32EE9|nr:hypothetical protein [Novosphingopyxis baekryungensis]